MLDKAPAKKLSDVLDQLSAALAAGDIDGAVGCFQEDCYWRDLVTFTWNIKTMEGRDQVRDMLMSQLAKDKAIELGACERRRRHRERRAARRLDQFRNGGCARLRPYQAEERQDLDAAHHHGRAEGP